MEKEHRYEDNIHIMDMVINELMIVRTIEEVEEFDKAVRVAFLKMFPTVHPQSDIIEEMFKGYCSDYNVGEWYESLFKVPIKKVVEI